MKKGPKRWMADLKLESEVLRLRREALDVARALIEQDLASEGLTPEEIELAACELCDRQIRVFNGAKPIAHAGMNIVIQIPT